MYLYGFVRITYIIIRYFGYINRYILTGTQERKIKKTISLNKLILLRLCGLHPEIDLISNELVRLYCVHIYSPEHNTEGERRSENRYESF